MYTNVCVSQYVSVYTCMASAFHPLSLTLQCMRVNARLCVRMYVFMSLSLCCVGKKEKERKKKKLRKQQKAPHIN